MVSPDAAGPRFVAELDQKLLLPLPHGSLDVDERRHHGPGMTIKPENGTTKGVSV